MRRSLLKRLRSERGMTMIELLIAAGMALVVLTAAGMVMVMAARNQPRVAERSADIQAGMVLQERIGREIRQGYRIQGATPSQMDLFTFRRVSACGSGTELPASEPAIPCRVTYACSGTTCTRSETDPEATLPPRVEEVATGLSSDQVFAYSPSATAPTYVTTRFVFDASKGDDSITLEDGFELRNR